MTSIRNLNEALGYAELITGMEAVRKKNSFVKFLLVFPGAILIYGVYGGLGPMMQQLLNAFQFLPILFFVLLFFHFLGNGHLVKGFNKIGLMFSSVAWEGGQAAARIQNKLYHNWLPLLVNLIIVVFMFSLLIILFQFLAVLPPVRLFLERFQLFYPGASTAAIFHFFMYNSFIPIGISFLAVLFNWLIFDNLKEL